MSLIVIGLKVTGVTCLMISHTTSELLSTYDPIQVFSDLPTCSATQIFSNLPDDPKNVALRGLINLIPVEHQIKQNVPLYEIATMKEQALNEHRTMLSQTKLQLASVHLEVTMLNSQVSQLISALSTATHSTVTSTATITESIASTPTSTIISKPCINPATMSCDYLKVSA